MTEKRLIQYKVLCDEYEEIARILFEIVESGEQIEGYPQIQEWVNNLYKENKQLKSENNKLIVDKNGIQCEHEWLKEENEQLKKENERLKQFIKQKCSMCGANLELFYKEWRDLND